METRPSFFQNVCCFEHKKSDGFTMLLKSGKKISCYFEEYIDPFDDPRDNPTGSIIISRRMRDNGDGTYTYGDSEEYDLPDIVGMIECPIGTPV